MTDFSKLSSTQQRALISATNIATSKRYGEVVGAYIFLFVLFHLSFQISRRLIKKSPTAVAVCSFPARVLRPYLLRKVPMFDSLGHAITIIVYWMIMIVLSFTLNLGLPLDSPRNWFAKRLGWMSLLNLASTMIFSIKNTPLSYLTGYSHERLNVLHRTAGVTTLVCFILHFVIYLIYWAREHEVREEITNIEQIHGLIAGFSLVMIGIVSIRPIRERFYEFFFKIHTIGYILVLINVGLHKPEITRGVVWVVAFGAASFVLGRVVRALRMIYNSFGNRATIIPLSGATKIVLKKSLSARPGDHVFITIPGIRAFESHPFTISDTDTTQLRVRRMDGFTAALHEYAKRNPGTDVKVLVEGPFGASPNFKSFDKVILIAGGVGATFSFAIALDIVRSKTWNSNKAVKMIWIVRSESHIDWFYDELHEIQNSNRIELKIYVTRPTQVQRPKMPEKVIEPEVESQISFDNMPVQKEEGRPDIKAAINDIIKTSEKTDNVIVSVCGPIALMEDVRNTVAKSIPISGPSVTLQSEQFGW